MQLFQKILCHYKQKTLPRAILLRIEEGLHRSIIPLSCNMSHNRIYRPYEVVNIPLEIIQNMVVSENQLGRRKRFIISNVRKVGTVKEGNWDLNIRLFSECKDMIAMKERFLEKKSWEKTLYYRLFYPGKNRNTNMHSEYWKRGCVSWEEFKRKFLVSWDSLYQSIKIKGYKSQQEMGGFPEAEIEVSVSRKGEVLIIDGKHRLAIAILLGIKKGPVIVNVWHKEYIDKIQSLTGCRKLTPQKIIKHIVEKG